LPPLKEPLTRVEYNSIWIITNKLTKYRYYIPYKEASTVEDLTYAFLKTIISQHGLPKEIISDKNKLFTSKFWISLMAQLGTNHKLSTTYHPQTDEQTERLNQLLEQYLQSYIGFQQDDWVRLLPLAQFAYNSSPHASTKMSPFYANYGYEPEAYKHPRKDPTQAEGAAIAITELKELQESLKKKLEFINNRITAYANKKRSMEPSLQEGDLTYLLRRYIKTKRPSDKLDFKKLGPYKILKRIKPVNYRLELPVKSKLHPIFHVSLLEPVKGTHTPNATEIQPKHEIDEYKVEEILDERQIRNQKQYLVKWLGYPSSENTWEPTKNLRNYQDKLKEYRQER